jgi:hypothetical protein
MSGTIKHEWSGSILTVISDSGVSSADLKGPKGNTGPRGPQGPAGIVYDEAGKVVVDLGPYATIEYVDGAMANIDTDLTVYPTRAEVKNTYATKNFVSTEIAKAQLEGAGVDTSGFATKDDLDDIEADIDNQTIIKDQYGRLKTTLGGYSNNGGGVNLAIQGIEWSPTGNWNNEGWYYASDIGNIGKPWATDVLYNISMTFKDGGTLTFDIMFKEIKYGTMMPYQEYNVPYNQHVGEFYAYDDGGFQYDFYGTNADRDENGNFTILHDKWVLTDITIYAPGYVPIDGHYIPVDGSTVYLNSEGKLACTVKLTEDGSISLDNYYTKEEVDALLAGMSSTIPSGEGVRY